MERVQSLSREFYLRSATEVAPELLGKLLVHRSAQGVTAGMIVEVEAYAGPEDQGAHSYGNRRTARTEAMFLPGGHAYIYMIYGQHACFNVVAAPEGAPEAVLIRALRPVEGIELMAQRRGTEKFRELCSGPGKLCQAMGITKSLYAADLCASALTIEPFAPVTPRSILLSPRINIDYAGEYRDRLWRYFLRDEDCVSRVGEKYRRQQQPLAALSEP